MIFFPERFVDLEGLRQIFSSMPLTRYDRLSQCLAQEAGG